MLLGGVVLVGVLLLGCAGVCGARRRSFMDAASLAHPEYDSTPPYEFDTRYYDSMPLDHFSASDTRVFKIKYLTNFKSYKPGGPMFFYTGNEGTIEGFTRATGIMFDLAPLFNASLVFCEHRYYGDSHPFGNQSESFKNVERLAYLSVQQALADFATLIAYVKAQVLKCPAETPVIAFGGSYGGMLTAWFRMKYPHVVHGAWAASAPVLPFHGGNIDEGAYYNVTSRTFVDSGCSWDAIAKAWDTLRSLSNNLDFLNSVFHIDPKSKLTSKDDIEYLVAFAREGFEYMAMVDYPYPNNFLKPVLGWPVKAACEFLKEVPSDAKTHATQLYNALSVYYNGTGTVPTYCINPAVCVDAATEALGTPYGWPWQACTEIIMEMCAKGGTNDFYDNECGEYGGSLNETRIGCTDLFKDGTDAPRGYTEQMLHEDAIPTEFGLNFAAASNIIFTNGYLDPWSSGGVTLATPGIQEALKNGVYVFELQAGAHHLDLRQPNTCDPPNIRNVRFQIVDILKCWTDPTNCKQPPEQRPLPDAGPLDSTNCSFITNGYPWGQVEPTPTTWSLATVAAPTTSKSLATRPVATQSVLSITFGCLLTAFALSLTFAHRF